MTLYNVFLRPEIAIKMVNIEAESQAEALKKAEALLQRADNHLIESVRQALRNVYIWPNDVAQFEYVELTEDINTALVDRVGDYDYRESKWYTSFNSCEWKEIT